MATIPKNGNEMQVISFASSNEWRKWIAENHAKSNGVWLQFFKKIQAKKRLYTLKLSKKRCVMVGLTGKRTSMILNLTFKNFHHEDPKVFGLKEIPKKLKV